jgi:hypothetical protein
VCLEALSLELAADGQEKQREEGGSGESGEDSEDPTPRVSEVGTILSPRHETARSIGYRAPVVLSLRRRADLHATHGIDLSGVAWSRAGLILGNAPVFTDFQYGAFHLDEESANQQLRADGTPCVTRKGRAFIVKLTSNRPTSGWPVTREQLVC